MVFFDKNYDKSAAKYSGKLEAEKVVLIENERNFKGKAQDYRVFQEKISFYVKKIEEEKKLLGNSLENVKVM